MRRLYLTNLSKFIRGFRWLWTRRAERRGDTIWFQGRYVPPDQYHKVIWYQKDWTPLLFLLLVYLPNVGTRVLTGGPVSTWSRWFYETRDTYPVSRVMNQLLDWLDDDHGPEGTPVLWGSKACARPVRVAAAVILGALAAAIWWWA